MHPIEASDTFLYFAYGSNMSRRRLQHTSRAPSAVPIGQAWIQGYRLVFDKRSIRDQSSKADCFRTGDLTDRIYGGLFRVHSNDQEALDSAEGATGKNPGYRRVTVVVQTEDGPKTAVTYLANDSHKVTGLLPLPWYVRHVLVGAEEFGLPAEYIAVIQAQATQPDPDLGRVRRELSIYEAPWAHAEAKP